MSGHSAESDARCDGCGKRPCVCETVVLPSAENDRPRYRCAECGEGISTADGLVTVNVAGHAKAAHRACPIPPGRVEP